MKSWDVIVIGSGAAGFAAAVTACCKGLSVLMLEKAPQFGGTSAISGGAVWINDSDQARAQNKSGSPEAMQTYLQTIIGAENYRPEVVDAFITSGREALAFLEKEGAVKYSLRPLSPDYYPDEPGAVDVGRALEVVEFDGRRLGARFRDLRSPPPGMLLFGGMMVNRVDIQHFLDMRRSLRSFVWCSRLLLRFGRDRLKYPRGTRLAMGNALIARMAALAFEKGMALELGVNVLDLIADEGRITGVTVEQGGETRTLHARCGVVLAAGGFAAGELAAQFRPRTGEHYTMSPPTNDGAALRLAAAVQAQEGAALPSNFFWAPVSVLRRADGSEERFPHLVTDRAKPGVIAVNQRAVRFVNESNSYHHFASAMQQSPDNAPCYLICDAVAMRRYGLGLARPAPVNNRALVEAGYLHQADSLGALAGQLGLDPQQLMDTVARYNRDAESGVDGEFGKGGNSYNRALGDPGHRPNTCNAPLREAPFYAVTLYTGDLGTSRGLVTNGHAQVLNQQNAPIPGLYAVGNDMDSMMAGTYPGPGITLGPALTFGYLSAAHMAQQHSL
ncbi:FAD-dependent oxidoreductase [Pluralibacter gergoviae]|uniref:FAD-dependent oxidoreductase n=1 Tax=Pluralibacter gergoviae TaxID=61647 RepID=A0AAI9GIW7_PLUGE|nr:FAD-dependent oxidoreductase [Pluralibacter gergoviae]EKV0914974.1 FAD-dependent oxidoreductase [Pluralibacter gergoviae]EKV9909309.1 FAD-dependent oxidoreductase [Pluralibacter gergoviae]EKW7273131.1 FAD-dependent oxidoreductase [Pluralibacter gergoviae]ELD4295716.1 FAD-dependent oxidoreductase [Pluralibacter gergoviae]ELD4306019.1 FAD-dependent oxidoreductase [Pluralibacter gergoviae]